MFMLSSYHKSGCLKFDLFIILQIRTGEESDERGHIVVREFGDFEWLDHCIRTQNDISGLIVRDRIVF